MADATTRLFGASRASIPFFVSLLFVLLATVPYGFPRAAQLAPLLAMISVYYWSIHRPDLMPAGGAFLVGVFVDMLGGGPFGAYALVMLLVHWVAVNQRRSLAGKSFAVAWLGYLMVGAAGTFAFWLITCVSHAQVIDPTPAILGYTVGIAAYPLVAVLLNRIHRWVRPV